MHLAQLNLGQLQHPLDHSAMADFTNALDRINAIAETSAGFVWRLTDEDGNSSSYVPVPGVDDPLIAVNYSIWESVESLKTFMFKTDHATFLRRRREWFDRPPVAMTACWWIKVGERPSLTEAHERLLALRSNGPSDEAWPLTKPRPKPEHN